MSQDQKKIEEKYNKRWEIAIIIISIIVVVIIILVASGVFKKDKKCNPGYKLEGNLCINSCESGYIPNKDGTCIPR